MPGATWRMRPQADRLASASRLGRRAVSSSDLPVSGCGSPPSPSSESSTILVEFSTTSGATTSNMIPPMGGLVRAPQAPRALGTPRRSRGAPRVTPPERQRSSQLVRLIGLSVFDRVFQRSQARDLDSAAVAGLKEDGWFACEPDAGRGAGGDEVTRLERDQRRKIAHEIPDVEDERSRVAVLHLDLVRPER